jgi:hypothetical protein
MSKKTKIILIRFLRSFFSGGIASSLILLSSGTVISSFAEFKTFVYVLAIGFISGGLSAIDKLLRWEK